MNEVLEQLNQAVGIKGSMVITRDGMSVASRMGEEIPQEMAAAMGASLLLRLRHALKVLSFKDPIRVLLRSSLGKIIVAEAGAAFLLVVADHRIKLAENIHVSSEIDPSLERQANLSYPIGIVDVLGVSNVADTGACKIDVRTKYAIIYDKIGG